MTFFIAWECYSVSWSLTEKGFHFLDVPSNSAVDIELDEYLNRLAEARGIPRRYVVAINCQPMPSSKERSEQQPSQTLDEGTDPLFDEALKFVVAKRRASISAIQRHLSIGYARASHIIEQLEAKGIITSSDSNGNREVL